MLARRLLRDDSDRDLSRVLHRLAARSGEPLVRQAALSAMRILGHQFVMDRTIEEALERAKASERHGYPFL
jgi:RHH-type transcriptional regulator, proline utilization regulon repressor / proline dehydrogenase / delta 1-pyrroline-5-carboxylate dehydrogenase